MHDPDCIFCKIARGLIPALKVWKSEHAVAFLDTGPLADGHTLVIPKNHYRDLRDTPAEVLCSLVTILPRLADAVMRATDATGLNLLQNTGRSSGQAVFHIHFHLIPRTEDDGLGYRWNAGTYGEGGAEAMRSRIIQELEP